MRQTYFSLVLGVVLLLVTYKFAGAVEPGPALFDRGCSSLEVHFARLTERSFPSLTLLISADGEVWIKRIADADSESNDAIQIDSSDLDTIRSAILMDAPNHKEHIAYIRADRNSKNEVLISVLGALKLMCFEHIVFLA